jgi:hypothetical protein
MTGQTKRHGTGRLQLGRLAPTLAGWLGAERVGTVGLAVLVAAALLAVGLAIHGYGNRGLALTSVSASTPSPTSSRQPSGTAKRGLAKPTSASTSTTSPPSKLGPALSSTQYAQYAYRIYPRPVSATAQQATAGYSISTKVSGSNVVLLVSSTGSSKPPSRRSYSAADTIYFVEANFGDDSGVTELNPGDDGLVVTNPQGLIVEG